MFLKHEFEFELMLYVPVKHVGTLPPFYGTVFYLKLGCHDTKNALYKYNHPTKPTRLICVDGLIVDGLTKPLFQGRLRHERFGRSEDWSHKQPIYFS